ncbi:MAG: hypothetical protein AB7F43_05220 [Bacteriovoracia bacterium]
MYRDVLQKLNFVIYLIIAIVACTLQSTIFTYSPLNFFQPDIGLILAVYLGMRRDFLEGGILVALVALILEIHSSVGRFFLMTLYVYIFVIAKLFSKTVIISDLFSSIGITTSLLVLKRLGILVLLFWVGKAENGLKHFFIHLIPGIIVHAIIAPALFSWFQSIDLRTYKDSRADDELFIDNI